MKIASRIVLAAMIGSVALCTAIASAAVIEGRVYLDSNRNGRRDADEPGVERVLVSDGLSVVATDASGVYRLESPASPAIIWICVPTDHAAAGAFWRLTDGAGAEDFGLIRTPQSPDFIFLQITDTHIGRVEPFRQFAEGLKDFPVPIAFAVHTGDMVGGVDVVAPENATAQFERYLGAAAAFNLPLFHVPGNHEHVSVNMPHADKTHPYYGKGLYKKLFGPMHYSWDWGGIHFVALDATSLPYQEKLGQDQLAWLAADLDFQPKDKPLIILCHQSLRILHDAAAVEKLLHDRNVLGAFCGHVHATCTVHLGQIPVYHTGALSGAWWSGPNPDGTPQGYRLVQIKNGRLKTAYTNREGVYPLYVSQPTASSVHTGDIAFEVVVMDFGRPVEASASCEGRPIPLQQAHRDDLWSFWRGTLDTRLAFDGDRVLRVVSRLDYVISSCDMRYLVVNGRAEPYAAGAPARLGVQVRRVDAPNTILFDGKPLAVIPADTPNETLLEFEIGPDRLARLATLTIRAADHGAAKDEFSVGPVWLEYRGRKLHDLRYPSFQRHTIGGADPQRAEKHLYFCLPPQ